MNARLFSLIVISAMLANGMPGVARAENSALRPVWELSKESLDALGTKGSLEMVDGVIKLDGKNVLSLPADIMGRNGDFSIEFEAKRPRGFTHRDIVRLVTNENAGGDAGFTLMYYPPQYHAGVLFVDGHKTYERRGVIGDSWNKISIVSKDHEIALFQNGLLLALTGKVGASQAPLRFGEGRNGPTLPYEFRNIRIYDQAIFPTGYDQSVETMRSYSGEGYFMQRSEIKDPSLPRILIVGDSISMGYRGFIKEHFKGRANVDYWVGGGWLGETARGPDAPAKRAWNGVLSQGPYDVVSWNASTLHMWNGDPKRCDEATYPANMTEVVEHLQKTAPHTKFIWIQCTPWRTTPESGPPTTDSAKNDMIVRLNAVTGTIMAAHGIPSVDLYALCEKRMDTVTEGTKDAVHWKKEVSCEMADKIIAVIEQSLPQKSAP